MRRPRPDRAAVAEAIWHPLPAGEGWGEGPVDRRSRTDENENEERDPGETLFSRTKRDFKVLSGQQ